MRLATCSSCPVTGVQHGKHSEHHQEEVESDGDERQVDDGDRHPGSYEEPLRFLEGPPLLSDVGGELHAEGDERGVPEGETDCLPLGEHEFV